MIGGLFSFNSKKRSYGYILFMPVSKNKKFEVNKKAVSKRNRLQSIQSSTKRQFHSVMIFAQQVL